MTEKADKIYVNQTRILRKKGNFTLSISSVVSSFLQMEYQYWKPIYLYILIYTLYMIFVHKNCIVFKFCTRL